MCLRHQEMQYTQEVVAVETLQLPLIVNSTMQQTLCPIIQLQLGDHSSKRAIVWARERCHPTCCQTIHGIGRSTTACLMPADNDSYVSSITITLRIGSSYVRGIGWEEYSLTVPPQHKSNWYRIGYSYQHSVNSFVCITQYCIYCICCIRWQHWQHVATSNMYLLVAKWLQWLFLHLRISKGNIQHKRRRDIFHWSIGVPGIKQGHVLVAFPHQ